MTKYNQFTIVTNQMEKRLQSYILVSVIADSFDQEIVIKVPLRQVISLGGVGLQIYKMINLGSNVIVYKLKHCVLHFEVNMMTF